MKKYTPRPVGFKFKLYVLAIFYVISSIYLITQCNAQYLFDVTFHNENDCVVQIKFEHAEALYLNPNESIKINLHSETFCQDVFVTKEKNYCGCKTKSDNRELVDIPIRYIIDRTFAYTLCTNFKHVYIPKEYCDYAKTFFYDGKNFK